MNVSLARHAADLLGGLDPAAAARLAAAPSSAEGEELDLAVVALRDGWSTGR